MHSHTPNRATSRTKIAVLLGICAAAAVLASQVGTTSATPSPPAANPATTQVTTQHACDTPATRHAACQAIIDLAANGHPVTAAAPASRAAAGVDDQPNPYTAADLQQAYRLPSATAGNGQTIAIVDAFDDPTAEADLATYRAANGLPACTSQSGCFRKVNQDGGNTPPAPNDGWGVEISLDLDMASATCPNCHLLLVESNDNLDTNLGIAVDQAVRLGANVVSNSYGGPEYPTESADLASHYRHPGAVILASSGDFGFGVEVPAAAPGVVAVGGTTLYHDANARGWTETAWPGAGSGCSAYITKPRWQTDQLCDKRTVADVAAVADPATPVRLFDTFDFPGWIAAGGTSVASPIVAGVYALAGNTTTIEAPPYLYAHRHQLFDVTTGSNGFCGGGYLCNADKNYDGPTGLGTPNGTGAF